MVCGHKTEIERINYVRDNENTCGILLIRDPRDILISFVKSAQAGLWPEGNLDQLVKNNLMEESLIYVCHQYRGWFDKYATFIDCEEFKTIKYANLVGIALGGNQNTQGQTIDTLARTVGVCSIEMSRGLCIAQHRPTWTKRADGARARQWQEHFTPKVKDVFKRNYKELLIKWGYEKDDNW